MTVPVTLSLSGDQHEHLKSFLFPADGKEAVALLLCGRRAGDRRERMMVRKIHDVPYERCSERTAELVTWHPDDLATMLDEAAEKGMSVIKVHSHPTGFAAFSPTDDEGDERLLPMIRGWVGEDVAHGSAVMLPDGRLFGRVLRSGSELEPIDCIAVAADDLHFWYADAGGGDSPSFVASHAQVFGEGTIDRLQRLSVAVVGASGTGSPVIEQLQRLGVGELVIVDDDRMEERNVNRVLNSTMQDVEEKRLKVDVQADAIERIGLKTRVIRMSQNLWNPDVVRSVAQCDVLFGCMDSIDGRFLLNALSSYYTLPYFDIGVRLQPVPSGRRKGRIEVCGTVNYLRPGRSSLMSRNLFTMREVAAAGLRRNDPDAHDRQVKDGYIMGAAVERPAVISVNMFASSLAVNEFLARLHPFREEPNAHWAAVTFSLSSMELFGDQEGAICEMMAAHVGKGDVTPLLGLPELAENPVP